MVMTPDYRRFVPLNGLSDEALAQAAGLARHVRLPRGQILFHQGDSDDDRYYLLSGEMALDAGDESAPLVIRADSEALDRGDGATPLDHALGDGEDFELILAVPPDEAERMLADQPLAVPLARIGSFMAQAGLWIADAAGNRRPLPPRGYVH